MSNLAELLRLINNLIRIGTIKTVDEAKYRCTVETGDNLTGDIPWLSLRAGTTKIWSVPSVGEQVLLLSPGGELANAIAITGLYSDSNAQPLAVAEKSGIYLPDGTEILYDHEAKTLTINLEGSATVNVKNGDCDISVPAGNANVDAMQVVLNGKAPNIAAGVITGLAICPYTSSPHVGASTTVLAGS